MGFSKDSRLPVEFELTHLLASHFSPPTAPPSSSSSSLWVTQEDRESWLSRKGVLYLTIIVPRWSDGSYLENQDMWSVSGILGSVYLSSTPRFVSLSNLIWSFPPIHSRQQTLNGEGSGEGIEEYQVEKEEQESLSHRDTQPPGSQPSIHNRRLSVEVWTDWDTLEADQFWRSKEGGGYEVRVEVFRMGVAEGMQDHPRLIDALRRNCPGRCPSFPQSSPIPVATSSRVLCPPPLPLPKPKGVRRALQSSERTRATVSFSCGSLLPNPYLSSPSRFVTLISYPHTHPSLNVHMFHFGWKIRSRYSPPRSKEE